MPKVLVIDDDTEVRRLICTMLRRGGGYDVVEATDGPSGLSAFAADDFVAVVTDLIMPGQTGIDTIKKLRALDPRMPIIAVSGFGWDESSELVREAMSAGANHLLGKPFRPDDLMSAIAGLLRAQ